MASKEEQGGNRTREWLQEEGYAWLFESTLLHHLDAADQDTLLGLMQWRDLAKDTVLVTAGQPGVGMDLIVEGEAQVVVPAGQSVDTLFSRFAMRTETGESVLARLAPGHVYGERSTRTGTLAMATVRSLTPMRILRLGALDFTRAIETIAAFRHYVDGLVALRDRAAVITDLLLRHPFLRLLGRDDIQRFVESGSVVQVAAGQQVVGVGEQTSDVYVVIRGRVGVVGTHGKARELIATKGPGWMFGHAAVLLEVPRTADIDALDATELLRVPASVLMAIVTRNPTLYRQLYQELATSGVRVGERAARKAHLVSIYGTRAGLGTTSIAWGLAASLRQELRGSTQDSSPTWAQTQVVLVDMGRGRTDTGKLFGRRKLAIGAVTCEELEPPAGQVWGIRVLCPTTPGHALELVHALQGVLPGDAYVLVAAASQDLHDKKLLHEAQSVVLVRSSSDGSHETAAERHQYRVDAIRLQGGVLPLEAAGRSVRVPDDVQTLARFQGSGELHLLASDGTTIGRSCRRLARALLGKSVGLALGGGGALGFAHVGLLRALEEARIPVDYIAGVSFGALVAGMYAAGRRDGIERLVADRLLLIPTLLSGFVTTRSFEWVVQHYLGRDVQMCETEIPIFPVGVDINTGREVVRAHGSVGHGVRSSSCLPGAYPSLVVGGQRIVDGGMHNNVPASVTWQAGAHFIIASNIIPEFPFAARGTTSKVGEALRLGLGRFDDLMRSLFLLMSQSGRDRAQLADYVFDLELHGYNIYDFAHGDAIAKAGYEQAMRAMPDIEAAWRTQAMGLAATPVAAASA